MEGEKVMGIWCLEHPWMTFFIILVALEVIGNVLNNILIVKNNKLKVNK